MLFDRSTILRLVRMSDAEALHWLQDQSRRDLKEAQDTLQQPLPLSFTERLAARAAGIDVAEQQRRFSRLVAQVLAGV